MKITTEEQANKLIAEAKGEEPKKVQCIYCRGTGTGPRVNGRPDLHGCMYCSRKGYTMKLPTWTSDANAALELWEDSQRIVEVQLTDCGYWVVWVDVDGHRFGEPMQHNTFCHAICHAICSAFLTSKGVEHEWEVDG